jgi:hypothetical protein
LVRATLAAIILAADFFGMFALFTVYRDLTALSVWFTIPLIVAFLGLTLVVPVLVVAFLLLGPVERGRARESLDETRRGGYASNYPSIPVRFADYRPVSEMKQGQER